MKRKEIKISDLGTYKDGKRRIVIVRNGLDEDVLVNDYDGYESSHIKTIK
ncbi:MAG: hypothetical protein ACRC42_03690 [Mycoplasma sp.]